MTGLVSLSAVDFCGGYPDEEDHWATKLRQHLVQITVADMHTDYPSCHRLREQSAQPAGADEQLLLHMLAQALCVRLYLDEECPPKIRTE